MAIWKNLLLFFLLSVVLTSCTGGITPTDKPCFTQFTYQGDDAVYRENPLAADAFYSPILQGCYPDPSIARKGDDYYLVCSSFAFYPGVPIFHSNDLVNWEQTGHVLSRPSQLKLENAGMSKGVYAPHIIYNPHNDTFYMITTHIGGGLGNMVVKTKDPAGEWSDPIKQNFDGIDPSLFFDDDGKGYIIHNDAPDKALYEGHRVIKIWDYDTKTDQVSGIPQVIVNGGIDITKNPIWIEAPHIYKKGEWYYLMCAEGGTGDEHSEVIFRSSSVKGPYIPAENNPILTQRHLPDDRPNKVVWAGHADLITTPEGKYYGVFLASRPNKANRINTGRETYILPVDWSDEFPVFEGGLEPLTPKLKVPAGVKNKTDSGKFFPNGNFIFEDNFKTRRLDKRWFALRDTYEKFASVTKNGLQISPFDRNIKTEQAPSMLCYRQQHNAFSASTSLYYKPASEKDLAGMVCYQKETFNYVLGITKYEDGYYVVLKRTANGESTIVASDKIEPIAQALKLQIKAEGDDYYFNYAVRNNDYINLGGKMSGDILSTNVAGGFIGCVIGLYATSGNDE
ncbi:MAG: glycoside hydrolase family 43 protein [Dysgonamonadaceae bacterium]|nr:glycoside hydrolase family 43 protein [Dysgonamonadaceae bacterium]